MRMHVAHGLHKAMSCEFPHDGAASDHTQISGQRTATSKASKGRHVAQQQFGKGVRAEIFNIVGVQFQTVSMRRVLNHLQDQTGESIDK